MGRPVQRMTHWSRVVPGVFILAWGGNHFTPLLNVYQTAGNYVSWQANLLLGMYVFGLIPGLIGASALSDRFGRKPILLIGISATILGSVLLGCGLHTFLLLCIGRVLAGIGVGVAMSVGTAWLKELSSPPFDPHASFISGAKRASLTLTLGFALGAGVSGVLAQYAPAPHVLPYIVHGSLSLASLPFALYAAETRTAEHRTTNNRWKNLRTLTVGNPRFTGLILPAAPWVFAAAGVAYAIIPSSVESHTGDYTTLYATVLAVLTLGAGAVSQTVTPWLNRASGGRALVIGLSSMTLGMVLAVLATILNNPLFGILVALFLGTAYGILVIAGLIEIQQMASSDDLAGLTGIYYALTYTGFLLPTLLAALLPIATYSISLSIVALTCAACCGFVWHRQRTLDR